MTIRAPENLQKRLAELAKNAGLTRNALVLQVLWDWAEFQSTPPLWGATEGRGKKGR